MSGGADRTIKLLFVTPDLRLGGAERHIATLVPSLPRDRFEARVCCISGGGPFMDEIERQGIDCLRVYEHASGPIASLTRLVELLRSDRPDVVMTQGFRADVLGRIAAAIARVPLVITWRHNTGHVGRYGPRDWVGERVLGWLTDQYYGVCHGQVPYLTGYLGLPRRKIRVVHNGVDPALYDLDAAAGVRSRMRADLGIAETSPVVAIVAMLREEKDHETFLRAFAEVRRALPDSEALVIGGGVRQVALEDLARELGIESAVHFLGNRSDVPELLAASDVVALSSYTVECFPYAILEAMAMARPSVVTAIAGLPELVVDGETGYLVPTHAPQLLAARLVDVLRRADRGRSMGRAARARLEANFTVRHSVERVVDEVDSALHARGAGRARAAARPASSAARP